MPCLYISTPGTHVSLISERLRIQTIPSDENPEGISRDIPISELEQVVIHDHASITMPAMGELLRRGIPIAIASGSRILGICHQPAPHSRARLEQYQKSLDPGFSLALAANWVEAKILNSRRILQRLAANREEVEVTKYLLALSNLAKQAQAAESLDTLRGYEGTAAGRYFEAYGTFFPDHAPFERRSRRPPHNAVNAILSYGYTLLAMEVEAFLHSIGLDPALGFFHQTEDGRPSLALDILEPFRAPLVDAMALDLISHGTLNPSQHFEPRNGGVYLANEGRKRFFVAYERRMDREFTSEVHGNRTSLRNEIRNQCYHVKKAVLDGEPFVPFLMN